MRDKYGLPIGRAQNNPILYTIMYEVEYKDGHKYSLASNAIAENMFAQVDGHVNWQVLFQGIFNHRYDSTDVKGQGVFIVTRTGTKRCRETKKGIEFLFQWKYGRTT